MAKEKLTACKECANFRVNGPDGGCTLEEWQQRGFSISDLHSVDHYRCGAKTIPHARERFQFWDGVYTDWPDYPRCFDINIDGHCPHFKAKEK